jgi:hypothetical protein
MTESNDERAKRIDEAWKEAAQKEKGAEGDRGERSLPKPDFSFFISSLAMEALIGLGEMENPITKKQAANLPQAAYLIDVLDMLKQKSEGNLSDEENKLIEGFVSDLKMRYVNKVR